jgi:hypothetical protein
VNICFQTETACPSDSEDEDGGTSTSYGVTAQDLQEILRKITKTEDISDAVHSMTEKSTVSSAALVSLDSCLHTEQSSKVSSDVCSNSFYVHC